MDTVWILVVMATLANGVSFGTVAGSYDELAECNKRSGEVREAIKGHIEKEAGQKVIKIDAYCTPHRFDEE